MFVSIKLHITAQSGTRIGPAKGGPVMVFTKTSDETQQRGQRGQSLDKSYLISLDRLTIPSLLRFYSLDLLGRYLRREFGLARRFRPSRPTSAWSFSTPRLNPALTHGIPPDFRYTTPISRSRDHSTEPTLYCLCFFPLPPESPPFSTSRLQLFWSFLRFFPSPRPSPILSLASRP